MNFMKGINKLCLMADKEYKQPLASRIWLGTHSWAVVVFC